MGLCVNSLTDYENFLGDARAVLDQLLFTKINPWNMAALSGASPRKIKLNLVCAKACLSGVFRRGRWVWVTLSLFQCWYNNCHNKIKSPRWKRALNLIRTAYIVTCRAAGTDLIAKTWLLKTVLSYWWSQNGFSVGCLFHLFQFLTAHYESLWYIHKCYPFSKIFAMVVNCWG